MHSRYQGTSKNASVASRGWPTDTLEPSACLARSTLPASQACRRAAMMVILVRRERGSAMLDDRTSFRNANLLGSGHDDAARGPGGKHAGWRRGDGTTGRQGR